MNELTTASMTEPLPARNAKLPPSIVKIMEGALKAIGGRGTRRLSMSDICNAAEISRGTLYRYFSTKEDVLAAVSEFVSSNFENGVREAAETTTDPMERFHAVMRFFGEYTNDHTPDRIFEIEPSFYIDFFRSHFDRHKIAMRAALNLTFDYLDTLADAQLKHRRGHPGQPLQAGLNSPQNLRLSRSERTQLSVQEQPAVTVACGEGRPKIVDGLGQEVGPVLVILLQP